MVSASAFAFAAALLSGLAVRADVVPSEPSPGSTYREGQTCTIVWNGDTAIPSGWKNMNIQLMTGDNFHMIPLTTVATNQDGTVSGRFTYPCPAVTTHSAIYFYQFTAPAATNTTWTTRFTITSATGETTPPTNPTQPGTNDPIPWGTGALVDPSQAVPPPNVAGGSASGPPSNVSTIVVSSSLPVSPPPPTSPSATPLALPASSSAIITSVRASPSATSTPNAQVDSTNGAVGMFSSYTPIYTISSLALSGLAFAFFL